TPLPRSTTKLLTDADHFSMIRTAQRRFAPTVIGITRNSDRHQIGMCDRHRRNTHNPTPLPSHLSRSNDIQNLFTPLVKQRHGILTPPQSVVGIQIIKLFIKKSKEI